MTKIVFIGAGSTVFMKNILTDVLLETELQSSHIVLHDIDDNRLQTSLLVAEKVSSTIGTSAKIEITADRKEALKNAEFVIVIIQVGGYKPLNYYRF